jgi:8-oxo-dGTP diphosphatase
MKKEKVLFNATLVFPFKSSEILLGLKVRYIGAGCYNGFGGGIKKGEEPRRAAVRELKQESHLIARPEDLEKCAIIDFHNTKSDNSVFVCRMHTYLVDYKKLHGVLSETKEMFMPSWFYRDDLPFHCMMLGDRYWLPLVLAGKKNRSYY